MLNKLTDQFGGKKYTVFVSHAFKDIVHLKTFLEKVGQKSGVEFRFAEHDFELANEGTLPGKISGMIDSSDAFLVVLSEAALSSNWINQEIGYALRAKKPFVPLVEDIKGKDEKLALLSGKELMIYKDFSTIDEIADRLSSVFSRLVEEKRQGIKSNIVGALIVGAALFVGSFLPEDSEDDYI